MGVRPLGAAVIGAGLSGAACVRVLKQAGVPVRVFETSGEAGGRLSSLSAETSAGRALIDHGAQYLTARGTDFRAFLDEARAAGAAGLWTGRLVSIDRGGNVLGLGEEERWAGVPAMDALVRFAMGDAPAECGRCVRRLEGGPGAWTLRFEDGSSEGPFAVVALTLPPEPLVDLLARTDADFSGLIVDARGALLAPCQAVMAVLDAPFDPGFDGAKLHGGSLAWMARNGSKPGRTGPEAWVLHARHDWSRIHLEDDPGNIARALLEEAWVRFGLPKPVWAETHRWRYALAEVAPGTPFALDDSGSVGCAGDWRLGGRAECAWDSGHALGRALAEGLAAVSLRA